MAAMKADFACVVSRDLAVLAAYDARLPLSFRTMLMFAPVADFRRRHQFN
jgi:hypothetical protein